MKISELKAGQGSANIEATVTEIGETREFNKYGRILKVANAMIRDDSGSIKLSLWNDDIDRVKVGNTIKITNGYVSEFQGEKQLTTGKFGKLEVSEGKPSTFSDDSEIKTEKISDSSSSTSKNPEKDKDKGETMKKKPIIEKDEEETVEIEVEGDSDDTEEEEEEEEESSEDEDI